MQPSMPVSSLSAASRTPRHLRKRTSASAIAFVHVNDRGKRNVRLRKSLARLEGLGRERHGLDAPFARLVAAFGVEDVKRQFRLGEAELGFEKVEVLLRSVRERVSECPNAGGNW
jgi:hypothetical protein